MNTNNFFFRTLVALFVVSLMTGVAFGQNMVIGADATFTGGGTYKVKGNIDNTAKAVATDIAGTVELNGTSAQAVGVATKPAINFETLKATAASTKTINVNSTVTSAIDVTAVGATKFDLGDRKLTLQGTIANTGGATAPYDFSNTSSEVDYAKTSGNQTTFGTTYGKLTLSGSSTHDLGGAVVAGAAISHSGGALTVNENLNANAAYTFGTVTDISTGKTMTLSPTGGSIATLTDVTGSLVNGSGAVTVGNLVDNHGTITAAANGGAVTFTNAANNNGTITGGAGTVLFSNTLANAGTVSGDLLDFDGNVSNSGTLSLPASAAATFAGSFTSQTGTISLHATSSWTYDGGVQDVAGGGLGVTYGHLTMAGTATKTALGDITVLGNFLNSPTITTDMKTYTLALSGTRTNTGATMQFGGTNNGLMFSTGTVEYNGGAITQVVSGHIADKYETLLFSNAGTKQVAAGTRVAASGNLTINPGITADVSDATSVLVVDGDLTNNGTLNNAGSVIVGGE